MFLNDLLSLQKTCAGHEGGFNTRALTLPVFTAALLLLAQTQPENPNNNCTDGEGSNSFSSSKIKLSGNSKKSMTSPFFAKGICLQGGGGERRRYVLEAAAAALLRCSPRRG
jgi:hypothetical protein